ncbi:MAG TPA: hypothetical protein VGC62_13670 [Pseudomonas sp.]
MSKLAVEVGAVELDGLLHQLIDTLTSLKQVPQFPFDEFHRLVLGLLSEMTISFDPDASTAGNLRAACGGAGNLELVTAALTALESYLHEILPREALGVETER